MNARIKNGILSIELEVEKPQPSSTGKTLLIASTWGAKRTTALFNGKPVSIVANAFVYPDREKNANHRKSAPARREEEEGGDDGEEDGD